jgi:hypothetical protein
VVVEIRITGSCRYVVANTLGVNPPARSLLSSLYTFLSFCYTIGYHSVIGKDSYMYPVFLMRKGISSYNKVNVSTVEQIATLVETLKSEFNTNVVWVFSPGGADTQSTAVAVQSKFGAGSHLHYHLDKSPRGIAIKSEQLSVSRPVIVVLKDSLLLHRVARELWINVEHEIFQPTEGVMLDIVQRTYRVYTAE